MAPDDSTRQISVSREALRADLAELELRLRTYLDAKLELKANADHVEKLEERVEKIATELQTLQNRGSPDAQRALQEVDDFRQGRFTEAFILGVTNIVNLALERKADKGWMTWQKVFAVVATLVAVGTITLAIVLATHNWGAHP